MTPEEKAELVRQKQVNCEKHKQEQDTFIIGGGSKIPVCAFCGITKPEYQKSG